MASPFEYASVASLLGSWPTVPVIGSLGAPTLLPRTLLTKARILSARKEPSAGFNVSGQSFYLDVDGTPFHISFTGVGNLSLSSVISQINGTPLIPVVAYRDNGFLRLESPTSGETSSLRIRTDISSDVLFALGLFSETISRGGDLVPAATVQPESQVALPGQVSWTEGEPFEARVFNRALFQLGINNDRNEGILSKKRIAVKDELLATYTTASPQGRTLSGYIYCGDVTAPTTDQLEKWFAVLDSDGRELVKENQIVLNSGTASFSTEADTLDTLVTSGTSVFQGSDPQTDRYVVPSGLTGLPATLNGVPLKIIQYRSPTVVAVSPVNPNSGDLIPIYITQNGISFTRTQIDTVKCQVDGVYDSPGGTRVENIKVNRLASQAVTRVELGDRILCSGATFVTSGVVPGDQVVWSGHGVTSPYSNNATYRVAKVIDERTLELVANDWGPVVLNPDLFSGTPGSVVVSTDGSFWLNPFIRFKSDGAIPANGQSIRILYSKMSTLRDATDDPAVFLGPGVKYDNEVDDTVQKAILAIIGPSATSITDYVLGDRRNNLEDLDIRLGKEHYQHDGRHSTIRPDIINFFPGVVGPNLILRNTGSDSDAEIVRMSLRNVADTANQFLMTNPGFMGIGLQRISYPWSALSLAAGNTIGTEATPPTVSFIGSLTLPGGLLIPLTTYYYRVASVDEMGRPSIASPEVSVTLGATDNVVRLTVTGASNKTKFAVYRGTSSGSYGTTYRLFGFSGESKFEDYDAVATTYPGTPILSQSRARTAHFGDDAVSFFPQHVSINQATNDAVLNVRSYADDVVSLTRSGGLSGVGGIVSQEGDGSPRILMSMDPFNGSPNSNLLRLHGYRFQNSGSLWIHRIGMDFTDEAIHFRDAALNSGVAFTPISGGGMKADVKVTTLSGNYVLGLQADSGDFLRMYSTASARQFFMGLRSAGNFYFKVGSNNIFVVDPVTGFVGVGLSTPDSNPVAGLEARASGAVSGLLGYALGTSPGVVGHGTTGPGVSGFTDNINGVGVNGSSIDGIGVNGIGGGTYTSIGVRGSGSQFGVQGVSTIGFGGYFFSSSAGTTSLRIGPQPNTVFSLVGAQGSTGISNTSGRLSISNGATWDRYTAKVYTLDAPVSNSTNNTAFSKIFSIPANSLRAGSTIRVRAGLLVTAQVASPGISVQIRLGGTTPTDGRIAYANQPAAVVNNQVWLDGCATVLGDPSGSTTINAGGSGLFAQPAAGGSAATVCGTESVLSKATNTALTVDVYITIAGGTATLSLRQFIVDISD